MPKKRYATLQKRGCRFCENLVEGEGGFQGWWHCRLGRFDGRGGIQYFAMSGIERPNKTVAAAQQDCPFFQRPEEAHAQT